MPQKGNKYAHLALPERQLDFHELGLLTQKQIIQTLETFLVSSKKEDLKKVLIITGKGLHSKNGQAIIKPLVQEYLRTSHWVKNFSFAPINQGAEGAIIVALNET